MLTHCSDPAMDLTLSSGSMRELWVCPEVIARVVSGELFASQLTISEAAQQMALCALDTFDHDLWELNDVSGGHALLVVTGRASRGSTWPV